MSERRADQDFSAIEPLLWRVLASLARHGFVVPPTDARDVIHDFYLDGWRGVREHFDSSLGSFTTYLASAFYKFARRRIVALQSWRQRHVELDLMAEPPSEDKTPAQLVEHGQQLAAIRHAFVHLPVGERSVLQDYLSDAEPSERVIASRHALTRYALRERLLNAVGRVAVEMGRIDPKTPESLVAFYLWHDGRSPKNVSNLLGIPIADVHSLKARFAADLLTSIRSVHPSRSKGESAMSTSLEMLKVALFRVGDDAALAQLRAEAGMLRERLDDEDDELELSSSEKTFLEAHPQWVAQVYSALAEDAEAGDAAGAVESAVADLRADEEREIGQAFIVLLEALPGEFRAFRDYFEGLTPVSEEEQAYLLSAPSLADVPQKQMLSRMGLTPLMFHDAVRGLELLFDRVAEQGVDPEAPRITNSRWAHVLVTAREFRAEVPSGLVLAQFGTTPGLRSDAREPMARWVMGALEYCPYLVSGYEAKARHGVLCMAQIQTVDARLPTIKDIVNRWSRAYAR